MSDLTAAADMVLEKIPTAPALAIAAGTSDDGGTGAGKCACADAAANKVFDFGHKVFSLPGARFVPGRDVRDVLFRLHLSDLDVGIPLGTLRREFGIEDKTRDSHLIELAEKALRFVSEIRPGDAIPGELLDGTASWPVEERHRARAKAKLMTQIATWFARDADDPGALVKLLSDAEGDAAARARVQEVFAKIAESLGIGADRNQEVIDRLDILTRELSYIEAQQEQVALLPRVLKKITDLARIYTSERAMLEELLRIAGLMQAPIAEFANIFLEIDAQTGEILGLLRNLEAHLAYIRNKRDDVRSRLLAWGNLIQTSQDLPVERNRDTEANSHALYHFLTSHYAPKSVWH